MQLHWFLFVLLITIVILLGISRNLNFFPHFFNFVRLFIYVILFNFSKIALYFFINLIIPFLAIALVLSSLSHFLQDVVFHPFLFLGVLILREYGFHWVLYCVLHCVLQFCSFHCEELDDSHNMKLHFTFAQSKFTIELQQTKANLVKQKQI